MDNKDLYKIYFNDGNITMLVATDLNMKECKELISRQERPDLYVIKPLVSR